MRPFIIGLTITSLIAVAPLDAQTTRRVKFGVGGGVSFVTGEDRDFFNDGFNIQGSVIVNFPTQPVAARFDLTYQRLDGKGTGTGAPDTLLIGNLTIFSGTLNAVSYLASAQKSVRPYLLGGLGIYRSEAEAVLFG